MLPSYRYLVQHILLSSFCHPWITNIHTQNGCCFCRSQTNASQEFKIYVKISSSGYQIKWTGWYGATGLDGVTSYWQVLSNFEFKFGARQWKGLSLFLL